MTDLQSILHLSSINPSVELMQLLCVYVCTFFKYISNNSLFTAELWAVLKSQLDFR